MITALRALRSLRERRGRQPPALCRIVVHLIFNVARYEHLPIYKAALDAAVRFERVVTGFSRYHK